MLLLSYSGNDKVINLLIKNEASVDSMNKDFETALHFASRRGNLECVLLLPGV